MECIANDSSFTKEENSICNQTVWSFHKIDDSDRERKFCLRIENLWFIRITRIFVRSVVIQWLADLSGVARICHVMPLLPLRRTDNADIVRCERSLRPDGTISRLSSRAFSSLLLAPAFNMSKRTHRRTYIRTHRGGGEKEEGPINRD